MVKIYSMKNCPMCDMLKEELVERNISFENITDTNILLNKNIIQVPMLEKEDGTILNLSEALKWVNSND